MTPFSSTPPPRNDRPADAAALWLARHDAGLTADEQADFQRWWAADPLHAAAWQEIESAWRTFDVPRHAGLADDVMGELDRRRHRRRWRATLAISSGLAVAAAALVVLMVRPSHAGGTIFRPEQRVLEDGSVVELNRGAEIEVRYEAKVRHVRLQRGEALFTVAKNSARPFIVSAGRVDVQAVGTAFVVRTNAEAVDVVVTEGRVAVGRSDGSVQPAAAEAQPVLVGAGGRLLVPAAYSAAERLQPVTLSTADLARRLAWRGPRLELVATRLGDAITNLNRENLLQLRVTDPALADLRLSGVFRADDAEGFARLLEANYDVRVVRHAGELELRGR